MVPSVNSRRDRSMTVSAIIPTYNRLTYIRRAIDSILAQTTPVNEIIVVDDGSTDGTATAVENWYGSKVRLIRQANTGVSGARRRGIQEAHGEWIAFLDSDDEWLPRRNAQLLEAASRVPADVAWIFGDLRLVGDQGEGPTLFQEYGLRVNESPHVFADSLMVQYPFQFGMLQGSFVRRKTLLDLDCFTQGLRSHEDLLAGFQVACHHRVAAIPDVVVKYFRTSDLTSGSLVVSGIFSRDYYWSRMLAFGGVIDCGRGRRPWNAMYASEVRGLCRVLTAQGQSCRGLALRQFRYGGFSLKGLAFLVVALFGRTGIRTWKKVAAFRRKRLPQNPAFHSGSNPLQEQLQSAGKS